MKKIGSYINGNYKVSIFDDGTKIRSNNEDCFVPIKPESMDVKITNMCDCGCPFCHENSLPDGKHGDIMNAKFIDSLNPYTELAIGGGNPLCHPQLTEFLYKLKERHIIPSMTINQTHLIRDMDKVKSLVDNQLIYGLGISFTSVTDELVSFLRETPNAVLHIINGVVSESELKKLFDQDFKVLILGYKQFRRGEAFYSDTVNQKMKSFYDFLPAMVNRFKVVSFDNLAIKQLDVKRLLSDDEWKEFYMGDDGQFTMYIDMVNNEFARSSISTTRYPLVNDITDMFKVIRDEAC